MEAVGTIVKVVQAIVKAAETARQNKKRCLDLADRARTVGDILREDRDSTTRNSKPPLERLKAALDDALELVESQARSGLGIPMLITSRRTAARFQDVETRITACVVDLGLAEQMASRRRDEHRASPEAPPTHVPPPQHGHATNSESAPVREQPPPQQQKGKDVRHGYAAQLGSPPVPAGLFNQYVEQRGKYAESLMQGYLAQSAQREKQAESLLQEYLAQSAQQEKHAQSLLQGYLAQSAQQEKHAQSLLQGYLAHLPPQQQQQSTMGVQSLLNGYFGI